ncbi:MAG: cupredoxin domain-containing protein [Actinomycetota bacterium]
MKRLVAAAVLLALGAGACASEQGGTPEPEGPAPAVAPVTLEGKVDNRGVKDLTSSGANVAFEMESDDNSFDPTFVKVTPGATVKVEVIQTGQAPHTFTIDSPAVSPPVDVVTNKKGEKKTAELTLPTDGVVTFYCRFHKDLGMQGAFYFREG